MMIEGLKGAAQREAQGFGQLSQAKTRITYTEQGRSLAWEYPTIALAEANLRIARKWAVDAH